MNNKRNTVIDLFCGCGGLSLGFEEAGYDVLIGIDNWEGALKTYQLNHKDSRILCADLATLLPQTVEEKISTTEVDVIIGGPPCQGFYIAGKRIVNDKRNKKSGTICFEQS